MSEFSSELGMLIIIAAALIYGFLRRLTRRYISVPIRKILQNRARNFYIRR